MEKSQLNVAVEDLELITSNSWKVVHAQVASAARDCSSHHMTLVQWRELDLSYRDQTRRLGFGFRGCSLIIGFSGKVGDEGNKSAGRCDE